MSVLDRFPTAEITERAAKVSGQDVAVLLRKVVLALLALPFIVLGWSARAAVFGVAWAWSAVLVGWETGPTAGRIAARTGEDG
jgi:hypothetical protein